MRVFGISSETTQRAPSDRSKDFPAWHEAPLRRIPRGGRRGERRRHRLRERRLGKGGNAHHVVYLIDRSGSMLDYFDYVRREMLNSIGKLKPVQDFHVVFFNAGQPLENPPQQLVAATPEYRQQAAEFLAGIRPELTTNPLPAMKRAFEVLDKADPKKKGRLLYMLTDGAFPDNDAVTKFFKQVNPTSKADRVHVCTFLYGKQPKDVAAFMEQLAKDNGGNFKIITEDE